MLKVGIAIYIKYVFDGKTKQFFFYVKVHYTVQYSTVCQKTIQCNSTSVWHHYINNLKIIAVFLLNENSVDAVSLKHMNFNPVVCLWIYQP